jgi:K+-sensing histidine kinase KdpD
MQLNIMMFLNRICFDKDTSSLSKDNGPGIEEKYHTKIFEMFQT